MTITAGLDVGGAHLKVALAEAGRTVAVRQIACPLWQGLDKLDAALAEAKPLLAQASRINFSTRLFNMIVTNVPGPQVPLYVLGRELEEVLRLMPDSPAAAKAKTLLAQLPPRGAAPAATPAPAPAPAK